MELVNYLPGQAFASEDAVLRPEVCIGYGLELIQFLDGRDVRIFLLNFQHRLSAVDRFLFEGHYEDCGKQDEKHDQNCRQTFAKDAAIAPDVQCFARFQDLEGVGDLNDPGIGSSWCLAIESLRGAIELDLVLVVHAIYQWKIRSPASVCDATSTPRFSVRFAALFGTKTMSFDSSIGSGAFPARIFPKSMGDSFRSPLC